MSKKTPVAEKKYFWNSKSGKKFNHFIEDVENDKYFKDDDAIVINSESDGEDLTETEEVDNLELEYGLMIEALEKDNKDMHSRIDSLEKELKDYEKLRLTQIDYIKDLEKKLLDSNSNLESAYKKLNQ